MKARRRLSAREGRRGRLGPPNRAADRPRQSVRRRGGLSPAQGHETFQHLQTRISGSRTASRTGASSTTSGQQQQRAHRAVPDLVVAVLRVPGAELLEFGDEEKKDVDSGALLLTDDGGLTAGPSRPSAPEVPACAPRQPFSPAARPGRARRPARRARGPGRVRFYQGFRRLWKARVIEDAPTAKVRSAHQGYVELVGEAQAMRGEPIIAPLSKAHCCWYRYTIEKKSGKEWTWCAGGERQPLPAARRDGECIVDPEAPRSRRTGSRCGTATATSRCCGDAAARRRGRPDRPGRDALDGRSFTGRNRYTEELILAATPCMRSGLQDPGRHRPPQEPLRDHRRVAARLEAGLAPAAAPLRPQPRRRDRRAEWEDARRVARAKRNASTPSRSRASTEHAAAARRARPAVPALDLPQLQLRGAIVQRGRHVPVPRGRRALAWIAACDCVGRRNP